MSDSELRQRKHPDQHFGDHNPKTLKSEQESEDDDIVVPGINEGGDAQADATAAAPTGTDTTPIVLENVTKNMSQRWKNWTVRFVIGALMIGGFLYLLHLGAPALVLLVMGIQIKCFSEIINIGYVVYKSQNLPWFRTLSWYFLISANYYVYGETMIDHFETLLHKTDFLSALVTYHRFISFSLYLAGFVAFVFSLKKRHYLRQFTLFGYTHVTLLIVAVGANLIIRNIFEGIFWFFLSASMIICNDIWAYFFGFFLGKTPLIKLSPKKTWEGFIGGGIATVVWAVIISNVMVHYDNLVCPVEYNIKQDTVSTLNCVRNPAFVLSEYSLPKVVQMLTQLLNRPVTSVHLYPITFHSIFLALFASLIGPFGGFFASGFKRAFKIKDFGDIFPGHGGFMDRFDCQILMGVFMYIYVVSFIRIPNTQKLLTTVFAMKPDDQLLFFRKLCEGLEVKGVVDCSCIL